MSTPSDESVTTIGLIMIYGWAILIILIVSGVLAYYAIFDPRGFLADTIRQSDIAELDKPFEVCSNYDGTIPSIKVNIPLNNTCANYTIVAVP